MSPTNVAHIAAVKVGLITHISGKIRRTAPHGSVGEKKLPRWQLQLIHSP
ncbi:MAG TPA: hypothetical protein VE667_11855 [Xanthobacteraceae bacterium]|nr:hypothetical protein [Xanthobacteraceae bacterium]